MMPCKLPARLNSAYIILCFALVLLAGPAEAQVTWTNGRWFDGTRFVARTMHSTRDGRLASRRPSRVVETIDLQGRYVVPAFGDAHHHGIDGVAGLEEKIQAFLRDGIFYVKNPNVIPDLLTPQVRGTLNRADSIDVTFSNGGITSSGSHPAPLHDSLADRGVFPGLRRQDMPGRGYFIIDDAQALAETWPRILSGRPDFIKVFLNGTARLRSGEAASRAGLTPAVLRQVVRRAHAAGLRVTAHIETAEDFATGVLSGVDAFAHLPHFGPRAASSNPGPYLITPRIAAQAARRGVAAVMTVSVLQRMHGATWDATAQAAVAGVHKQNIDLLSRSGVRLAIGSDGISGETPFATARSEVEYLRQHRLMNNLSLLRTWSETTPQLIFPNRKIGRLADGYEANFLVLEGDPIADSSNLFRIARRVKAGRTLPPM